MSSIITLPLYSQNRISSFIKKFQYIITSIKTIEKLQDENTSLKNQLIEEEHRAYFWKFTQTNSNKQNAELLQKLDSLQHQLSRYRKENSRLRYQQSL